MPPEEQLLGPASTAVDFYASTPVLDDFTQVSDLGAYAPVPDDWHVVVADVRGSTRAAMNGGYKAVNVVGVAVIAAVRNAVRPEVLPYVFGGDGATLCLPDRLLERARLALTSTREMARAQFGLDLRVGAVPVEHIRRAGHEVLLARHRVSKFVLQAAFAGRGIEYAEHLIKDDEEGLRFRLQESALPLSESPPGDTADFTGLECRWSEVPSVHGEVISLLIKATAPRRDDRALIYREAIETIGSIYGDGAESAPVRADSLRLCKNPRGLGVEHRVRTFGRSLRHRLFYAFKLALQVASGSAMMAVGLERGGVCWGEYKADLANNSDSRKFDGVLRQVLSGTSEQRLQLCRDLERLRLRGGCVYGLHVSSAALVTCLIESRLGEHFHFVDGAGGGYCLAAVEMKGQLRDLKEPSAGPDAAYSPRFGLAMHIGG